MKNYCVLSLAFAVLTLFLSACSFLEDDNKKNVDDIPFSDSNNSEAALNLWAALITGTYVKLEWDMPEPENNEVLFYRVYKFKDPIGTTREKNYTVSGLSLNTRYTFRVMAYYRIASRCDIASAYDTVMVTTGQLGIPVIEGCIPTPRPPATTISDNGVDIFPKSGSSSAVCICAAPGECSVWVDCTPAPGDYDPCPGGSWTKAIIDLYTPVVYDNKAYTRIWYQHLDPESLIYNSPVKKHIGLGDKIGNTGNCNANHLHFGLLREATEEDKKKYNNYALKWVSLDDRSAVIELLLGDDEYGSTKAVELSGGQYPTEPHDIGPLEIYTFNWEGFTPFCDDNRNTACVLKDDIIRISTPSVCKGYEKDGKIYQFTKWIGDGLSTIIDDKQPETDVTGFAGDSIIHAEYVEVSDNTLPDLVCSGITTHKNMFEGLNYPFTAVISNIGIEYTGMVRVVWYVDNMKSGVETAISLPIPPGGSQSTTFIWNNASVGGHRISIVVDPDNKIIESDESNNASCLIDFLVSSYPRPNLVCSDIIIPSNMIPGVNYTFEAIVSNTGTDHAGNVSVDWHIGGRETVRTTINSIISPGSSRTATYTWLAESGNYIISVFVDPENAFMESDETDNACLGQSFYVPYPVFNTTTTSSILPRIEPENWSFNWISIATDGDQTPYSKAVTSSDSVPVYTASQYSAYSGEGSTYIFDHWEISNAAASSPRSASTTISNFTGNASAQPVYNEIPQTPAPTSAPTSPPTAVPPPPTNPPTDVPPNIDPDHSTPTPTPVPVVGTPR
ncbi:MAG: hypothetical protein JW881_03385 [Spirochaetales bacterium]|nr:hypothetical protein [Spirochaetales bacterium]